MAADTPPRAKPARKPRAAAKPVARAAVSKAEDKGAPVTKTVPAKATSRASNLVKKAKRAAPAKPAAAAKSKPSARAPRTGKAAGMLGAAAAGLAAGLAANIGRKAVVQAPSAFARDWFEALKGEHRAALGLMDALAATKDTATRTRSALLTQLKHALTKHALVEENILYPVLREAGEKGVADKFNHEHGLLKDFLYQLGTLPKGAPGFLLTLAKFRRELESHIREEEQTVFPALHAKLGPQKNKAVTQAANKEGFLAA